MLKCEFSWLPLAPCQVLNSIESSFFSLSELRVAGGCLLQYGTELPHLCDHKYNTYVL